MIVISGITSALGIDLALYLVKKGIRVLGFSRNVDKVKTLLNHPLIELVSADLNDPVKMEQICAKAKKVVHLAAFSSPWGKYSDHYRVNVEGTQSLLKAFRASEATQFVHVSTPSITFDFRDQFGITEEKRVKRFVNHYAATKKKAEEVILNACFEGVPALILRPRGIFGPHDKTLFPRLLEVNQKGGVPYFGKGSPIVDITYVENVSHAIWLSLHASEKCYGQIYNITNAEPVALDAVLEDLFSELGIQFQRRKAFYPIAYAYSLLAELWGALRGKEPALTRYGVGILRYSQTLSLSKAEQELHYKPIVNLKEGIRRYVSWFQAQKNL